jgi:ABC-type branched-subunit amino acid transport system permease subunit
MDPTQRATIRLRLLQGFTILVSLGALLITGCGAYFTVMLVQNLPGNDLLILSLMSLIGGAAILYLLWKLFVRTTGDLRKLRQKPGHNGAAGPKGTQ